MTTRPIETAPTGGRSSERSTERDLVITVTNDGRVHDGTTGSSGLTNMRARAESRRGSMSVGPADDHSTRIEWRVPSPQ